MRGAVERVAGGEDAAVVADVAYHADLRGINDALLLEPVAEGCDLSWCPSRSRFSPRLNR